MWKNPKAMLMAMWQCLGKCNDGTYFGGNLVTVCFLQIKSDVHTMKIRSQNLIFCYYKIQGNWDWEYLHLSMSIMDFKMSLICLDKFLFLFP